VEERAGSAEPAPCIPNLELGDPEDDLEFELAREEAAAAAKADAGTPKEETDHGDVGYEVIEDGPVDAGNQDPDVAKHSSKSEEEDVKFEVVEEGDGRVVIAQVLERVPEGKPVPAAELAGMLQAQPAVSVPPAVDALPVKSPDRPRRRPRKRPRRREEDEDEEQRSSPFRGDLIPGISNFITLLIVLGATWVLLGGLALLLPPLGGLLAFVGLILATGGQIWFLIVAFQEDFMAGILCLFVPFYALYFLITNLETAGRAFLINVVGMLMLITGLAAMGAFH
jgi:hypothetical protein